MKPMHGQPKHFWEEHGLSQFPPVECDFRVGDKVIYTNDNGLKFDMEVVGFSKDASFYGRFIHLIAHKTNGDGSAWWSPHHPSELCMVV